MNVLNIMRRQLTAAVVAAAALGAPAAMAQEAYPSDTISFVSGYPAGSGADVLVRFIAEKMAAVSGATIIVENKPGATGNIATEHVARAKPDGYTVLVHAGSGMAGNMHLYPSQVDVVEELQLVGTINKQGFMLVVDAKGPHQSVADLTKYLKEKGDAASYGNSSTTGKIVGEMYKQVAGLKAVQVNYSAGPETLNDLMSGALDYAMLDPVLALAEQRKGRLRILAVCTGERMDAAPEIPTMREQGVDMELLGWWSAGVPKDTPREIVDTLNGWLGEVLAMEDTKKFLQSNGGDPFISSADDAQKLLKDSVEAWGRYIEIAKIEKAG